jgi:uncharacterized protein (DUF305 family)
MIQRPKLFRALSISGLAGALVGVLILVINSVSVDSRHAVAANQAPALVVSWCDGRSGTPQSQFYAEIAQAHEQMHQDMDVLPSGDIDRDFARMMIPHHQGAIDMALVLLKHGHDERLRRLAQSIIVEQGQEIAYMRSLLAAPTVEKTKANAIADPRANAIADP